jgi:hypothetical protein
MVWIVPNNPFMKILILTLITTLSFAQCNLIGDEKDLAGQHLLMLREYDLIFPLDSLENKIMEIPVGIIMKHDSLEWLWMPLEMKMNASGGFFTTYISFVDPLTGNREFCKIRNTNMNYFKQIEKNTIELLRNLSLPLDEH